MIPRKIVLTGEHLIFWFLPELYNKPKITIASEAEVKWEGEDQIPDEYAKSVLEGAALDQKLALVAFLVRVHSLLRKGMFL